MVFSKQSISRFDIAVTVDDSIGDHDIATLASRGASWIEFRVDRCRRTAKTAVLKTASRLRRAGLPLIATVRAHAEGGALAISDETRGRLYRSLIPRVDCIDVELSSKKLLEELVPIAENSRKNVIVSHHDFEATPPASKLERIFKDAVRAGADRVKVAALAENDRDMLRLLEFCLRHRKHRVIVIAMGGGSVLSRLFFPLAGSTLTYSCLDRPAAPGQLPLSKTRRLLDSISRAAGEAGAFRNA